VNTRVPVSSTVKYWGSVAAAASEWTLLSSSGMLICVLTPGITQQVFWKSTFPLCMKTRATSLTIIERSAGFTPPLVMKRKQSGTGPLPITQSTSNQAPVLSIDDCAE